MKTKVTAIFDIGKTNKKFFLFDKNYQVVYREYMWFDEIEDEDGHPSENLTALQKWVKEIINRILELEKYNIKAINFSTYGASLVHLDNKGIPLTPLYNYTKPIDKDIIADFYKKYGPENSFTKVTGSPKSGMLNSGMQLYWLKKSKPEVYKKIKYSLHFPQYLCYIFTGIPLSEYTSIGCHTSLWDYGIKDYHQWVYDEGIDKILPTIVATGTSININYNGKQIKIGVGIHDSSSALIPYVRSSKKPFILVSTGTWSVSLNPFVEYNISEEGKDANFINYMSINGKPVKSTRVFLGNEYKIQVQKLTEKYNVPQDYHKSLKFNQDIYFELIKKFKTYFKWESIKDDTMPTTTKIHFDSFEKAYHQLMTELILIQVKNIEIVRKNNIIENIYVDGGFSDNDIYINLLSYYLKDMKLRSSNSSLGSALGAAMCISDSKLNSGFLKMNYTLKKHVPIIIRQQ